MRRSALVLLAAAALLMAAAPESLTIKQKTTTSGGGKSESREEMQYVAGGKLVIDGPDTRTIVDLDAKTMTLADKHKSTYFVMTFDEMRAQADAVQKRLKEMPPEVRKQMESVMGGGAPVTLTPTGKHEKIAGYDSNEYALAGGPFQGAVWATEDITVPQSVIRWRELSTEATAAEGPGRKLTEALAKVKGVPLRTSMTANVGQGTMNSTTEVLEVSTATPPPEVTKVPDGFKKVSAPQLPPDRPPPAEKSKR